MAPIVHDHRALKAWGLKNTKQRKAILNILVQSDDPLTADEIYIRLKAENTEVSLSTVYRALELLCAHSVLQSVTLSGDNRMAYVLEEKEHHHYIVCSRCKRILPISHCPLQAFEKALAKETGFVLQGHRLDLYGLCPECQRKQSEDADAAAAALPKNG
ncbi:MAG: transcriptional repressor [Clostridiales bacterium]|nr:transcriptional repressor [Clostridiales bacterium]